ncbi:MAG: Gfo/Idh/MocA family oxidoreductase [Candidatus Omnitrophica bacterium]|nr:Gfo/Idh/MocA family oxidoreductase [Candidatus Omnitrophota bacterium]
MKKYVLAGTSGRGLYMYAIPIKERFSDVAQIVGIFDTNPLRAEKVKEIAGLECPAYTDFDKMLKETKPDVSIITTVDRFHHFYIIKSLDSGMDAITEKPMTIDADKCNAILETEKRTGKKVIVTFNYRFTPYVTYIKELISSGIIGRIFNIHFEWMLDTKHGADYFRRWHRIKENSGGLLVHKATHHFDIINWFLEDEPEMVMAFGALRFYGHTREERGERCLTCQYKKTCEFFFDLKSDSVLNKLYLETEKADGYFRDRCVFADEINIEDTMSLNLRYRGGAFLSYSLIAHSPYEGYKMSINGTKGRMEIAEYHSGIKVGEASNIVTIYDRKGKSEERIVPKVISDHGGGDEKLQKMLFYRNIADPLNHMASSYDGAISILIGAAANVSIKEGRPVYIRNLVPLDKYRPERVH